MEILKAEETRDLPVDNGAHRWYVTVRALLDTVNGGVVL